MPTIAILCTSSEIMPKKDGSSRPSGVWYEELATPYLKFIENGYTVNVFSVKGGKIPFDEASLNGDMFTADCKKFKENGLEEKVCFNSAPVSSIEVASADALYIPGGHACYGDMLDDAVTAVINQFVAAGKVVAADCHGPVAFCSDKVVKSDGTPLVAGIEVTCFTDSEEAAVGATESIPYSMQQKLTELGGKFSAGADWGSNVCISGKVVTGQNPASSGACAEAVISLLA